MAGLGGVEPAAIEAKRSVRLNEGSSETASFIMSRKRGVRGYPARVSSHLLFTGGLFGNR
jgi:hypothetical protein